MRAPNSFIDAYDVIRIFVVWIYQWNQNLLLRVRKRAEIMVLAGCRIFVKILAKFGFVASRVVQLLNFIVRSLAIAVRFHTGNMAIVVEVVSSSIFLVVKAQTCLSLMAV